MLPELIALAIRDWCRLLGAGTAYIEPGSPWHNPFVESFNGRARDELFAREVFRQRHGGPSALRGLVRHLPSPPPAQCAWLLAARGLRGGAQQRRTLIAGGPPNGFRSAATAPAATRGNPDCLVDGTSAVRRAHRGVQR